MDGLYGAIIVHPKGYKQPVASQTLIAADYLSKSTFGASAGAKVSSSWYITGGSNEMNNAYKLRWYYKDSVELSAAKLDGIKLNGRQANDLTPVPAEVIDLTHFNRLHLICASADYGIEFKLESSAVLNILEIDGYPINPVLAKRLFLQPGETAVVEVVSSSSNVDLIATAGGHHKNETYIGTETFHSQDRVRRYFKLFLTLMNYRLIPLTGNCNYQTDRCTDYFDTNSRTGSYCESTVYT